MKNSYDKTHFVLTYNNIIFIVDGSGIAVVLFYLQDFFFDNSVQFIKRVYIIWIARQQIFVRDILNHELAFAIIHVNVKFDFYVIDVSFKFVKNITIDLNQFDDNIEMRYVCFAIVSLLFVDMQKSIDITIVLICEFSQMTNDARLTFVKTVTKEYDELKYYEKIFGW